MVGLVKRLLGRRACPWCGFTAAHVRRSEGKLPYVHCPQCGLGTQAKNGTQAELLLKGMRSELGGHVDVLPPPGADDIVTGVGELDVLPEPKPAAPVPPAPTPKPKRQSWFSTLLDKDEA